MKNDPLITISVVSHGDAAKVAHLLASLKQHEPDTKQFQLILTDNLRGDLPDFDPLPWVSLHVLRNNRQMGFAQNHNQAFEIARGRYFAILNPDLIFEEPVFDKLIAKIDNQQADLIAPTIVDQNGIVQDSFRALPTPSEIIRRRLPGYRFHPLAPDNEGLIHPDWMAAMFWLMPSAVFRQLGGLDEKYRLYFEDVDFCTRARLAGMRIMVDTHLHVRHDAQRSSRRKFYYLLWHTQSALRFFASPVYRQARMKLGHSG
jgi:GT2 family glycosyltransferase